MTQVNFCSQCGSSPSLVLCFVTQMIVSIFVLCSIIEPANPAKNIALLKPCSSWPLKWPISNNKSEARQKLKSKGEELDHLNGHSSWHPEHPVTRWVIGKFPCQLTNQWHFSITCLTWIPAWISKHMPCNVWDEITYPFVKFNGSTLEV